MIKYKYDFLSYKVLKLLHWHYRIFYTDFLDLTSEHKYEKVLKVNTKGTFYERTDKSEKGDETFYIPASYYDLKLIFKKSGLSKSDVFIDFGSGKGRVVFFASYLGVRKAIGVELRKPIVDEAIRNIHSFFNKKSDISFFHIDAVKYVNDNITFYFFYNPFGIETLSKVIANIHSSLINSPRRIKIVYWHSGQFDCKQYLDELKWLKPSFNGSLHPWRHVYLYENV